MLIQSVRGTDGSGGAFDPFRQEREDGLDTLEWIERQPWCSGDLATFGASYLGFTQWALAGEAGPRLKAMAVQAAFSDFRDAVFPGGAFALQTFFGWVTLMQHPSALASLGYVLTGGRRLKRALDTLPLAALDRAAFGHETSYYQQWLQHEAPGDPWWASAQHGDTVAEVDAPVHLLSGQYDFFLPQVVRDYAALRAAGKRPYLTIGPWSHGSTDLQAAAVTEGLAWFDAHVKGDASRLRTQPVHLWIGGAREWRDYPDFPPPGSRPQPWYLHVGGLLALTPPEPSSPETYRYDPADPTPSVGGPLGPDPTVKAGPVDNRRLESRPDVLLYTSAPLERAVEVIGPVAAELHVDSSLEHADFFARVCDVAPAGAPLNVCDGIVRVGPGRPERRADGTLRARIELWPTAHRFERGHCIRLQVSSGAHPRFARNLGTGEPLATGTRLVAAAQRVHHDPDHPSALVLMVLDSQTAE